MEKNYNYNFEQRAPQQQVEVTFSNIGVTECKKSVFNEKFGTITDGKLYHLTDTNEFFYDWGGKRYKLDLFGSTSIEDAQEAAIKATEAAEKAERVANDASQVAEEVRTLISGIKTIESVTEISNGYELTLSDGSKLTLLNGEKGDTGERGEKGEKGADGKSAYDIAVANGFNGTEEAWLNFLKGEKGADGKSAFDIARDNMYVGSVEDWLNSLKGKDGKDGADGRDGEKGDTGEKGADGEKGEKGEDGFSAYEIALAKGFEGDESAWLESLKGINGADGADGADGLNGADGKSAYDLAVVNGFEGTEIEWLASLKGADGAKGEDGKDGEGITEEDRAKLDAISTGVFPDDSDWEGSEAKEDGFATVQDVMNYVNLLFEKKKIDEPVGEIDYVYANGYPEGETPSDIAIFNPYTITLDNEDKFTLEFVCGAENGGYLDGGYYAVLATVDIPNGYELLSWEVYDEGLRIYGTQPYTENPRSATKKYGSVTYNSYVRIPGDGDQYTEDVAAAPYKYRIIIKKK